MQLSRWNILILIVNISHIINKEILQISDLFLDLLALSLGALLDLLFHFKFHLFDLFFELVDLLVVFISTIIYCIFARVSAEVDINHTIFKLKNTLENVIESVKDFKRINHQFDLGFHSTRVSDTLNIGISITNNSNDQVKHNDLNKHKTNQIHYPSSHRFLSMVFAKQQYIDRSMES